MHSRSFGLFLRGSLAMLFLFALPAAAVAQPAPPLSSPTLESSTDPIESHVQRARQWMAIQRYGDALAEWQAAYGLRQDPWLLLELARAQHRLGMGQEAITSYRRYLVAEPNPPPAQREEAQTAIVQLQAFLPRATAQTPGQLLGDDLRLLPVRVVNRPYHRGMVAAGWTLLSIGYAFAFGAGIGMGMDWTCSSCGYGYPYGTPSSAAGWTLLIPVIGPLVSGIVAPVTAQSQSTTYALVWTLPWVLTDLPLQVVGATMLYLGYHTKQQILVPSLFSRVQIRPYSTSNGGGLMVRGSF